MGNLLIRISKLRDFFVLLIIIAAMLWTDYSYAEDNSSVGKKTLEQVLKDTRATLKEQDKLKTPEERVAERAAYKETVIPKQKWWERGGGIRSCYEYPARWDGRYYACTRGNKRIYSGSPLSHEILVEACCGRRYR